MIITDVSAPTPQHAGVRIRRRVRRAGALLALGAGTLATAEVLHPEVVGDGPAAMAASFAERPGRWLAWAVLIMATALLQLPGVLHLRAGVVGRGARLVAAGAGLTAVSLVCLFGFALLHAYGIALVGRAPVDAALVHGFERADGDVTVGLVVLVALLGFHLGWSVLLAGLARAGLLPVAWAVTGIAAALGSFVADAAGRTVEAATFVVLAAVLVVVARRTMRGGMANMVS